MVLPHLEKPVQINIDKRITDIKKYTIVIFYQLNAIIVFCNITLYAVWEKIYISAKFEGDFCIVDISNENIPDDAMMYVASYGTNGQLLEIQKVVFEDGSNTAQNVLNKSGVFKVKFFAWQDAVTIKPLCDLRQYIMP